MAIDLTSARATAAAYLLGDTFYVLRPRVLDDGAGGTYPDPAGPERIGPFLGAFSAVDGDEAADDVVAVRGRYRLKTAIELHHPTTGAVVVSTATDAIEVVGRIYAVVWDPPPAALSLFRKLGLKDS